MTFCTNCGQYVEEKDKYCENCGVPLKKPIADGVNDEELPLGVIAGFEILAGKNKRAHSAPVAADPVSATPVSAGSVCQKCGTPATFVEEYQLWYCYECKEYLQ